MTKFRKQTFYFHNEKDRKVFGQSEQKQTFTWKNGANYFSAFLADIKSISLVQFRVKADQIWSKNFKVNLTDDYYSPVMIITCSDSNLACGHAIFRNQSGH